MKKLLMTLLTIVAAACTDGGGHKSYPRDPIDGWYGGPVTKQWAWEGEDPRQVSQDIAFFPFKCRETVCALSSAWGTRDGDDGLRFDETFDDIFFVGVDEDGNIYPFHYWYTVDTSGTWNVESGGDLQYDLMFYNQYGDRVTSYYHLYTFGPQTKYEPPEITGNDAPTPTPTPAQVRGEFAMIDTDLGRVEWP